MTNEQFDEFFEQVVVELRELAFNKGKAYANRVNRFHNFDRAASVLGGTKEQALLGFMTKHWVRLMDLINTHDADCLGSWDEVIKDLLVYLILLKGIVATRFNDTLISQLKVDPEEPEQLELQLDILVAVPEPEDVFPNTCDKPWTVIKEGVVGHINDYGFKPCLLSHAGKLPIAVT